jgi:hypothetical protein
MDNPSEIGYSITNENTEASETGTESYSSVKDEVFFESASDPLAGLGSVALTITMAYASIKIARKM